MKEKISLPGKLEVRQDPWPESPCADCSGTPCCRNLPLTPFDMKKRSDFVNLSLISCYNGIFPALKKSGEWTIYLERDCRYLNSIEGKCTIHNTQQQSMICKSYDAHTCWYINAFSENQFTSMIPFNTEMLIWFEKKYNILENNCDIQLDWEELCSASMEIRKSMNNFKTDHFEPCNSYRLPFKKSRLDQYLFFPPYKRPANIQHFELLSFRLGFPGIYLAVSDSCWAFIVKTEMNSGKLEVFRREYFPGIEHKDGEFSFNNVKKEQQPFTESGEMWVVLNRSELDLLKKMVTFDSFGEVVRFPSCRDILDALRTQRPDKAA